MDTLMTKMREAQGTFWGLRDSLTLVLHLGLLQLAVLGASANHNKWWTCNDACARCVRRVMPMEEMIAQLYPGLFSNKPPKTTVPVTDIFKTQGDVTLPVGPFTSTPGSTLVTSGTGGNGSTQYVDSQSNVAHPPAGHPFEPGTTVNPAGCCETMMEYTTPLNVTIGGRIYKVVHLQHMFQFIPVGRCKQPGSKCGAGQCVDQYRAHWVLVYNSTQPLQGAAPVSFAPMDVSAHCQCLNVGH